LAQVERSQLNSGIKNTELTDNLEGLVQGQNNKMKHIYFFTQITGLGNELFAKKVIGIVVLFALLEICL